VTTELLADAGAQLRQRQDGPFPQQRASAGARYVINHQKFWQ